MVYDLHEEWIKERGNFIAWVNRHVPLRYRRAKETPFCFSPMRDFEVISDFSFSTKRDRLVASDPKLMQFFAHLMGEPSCERCLRLINARAIYLGRHHHELFTEATHKSVWLELCQRNKEHYAETQGNQPYWNDGLFLLRVLALQRGCPEIRENHLLFFAEHSLERGARTFRQRIAEHPHLVKEYPGLRDLMEFGDTKDYHFPWLKTRLVAVSSSRFSPRYRGHRHTIVEIISKHTH